MAASLKSGGAWNASPALPTCCPRRPPSGSSAGSFRAQTSIRLSSSATRSALLIQDRRVLARSVSPTSSECFKPVFQFGICWANSAKWAARDNPGLSNCRFHRARQSILGRWAVERKAAVLGGSPAFRLVGAPTTRAPTGLRRALARESNQAEQAWCAPDGIVAVVPADVTLYFLNRLYSAGYRAGISSVCTEGLFGWRQLWPRIARAVSFLTCCNE
jgi:hypothetical protein